MPKRFRFIRLSRFPFISLHFSLSFATMRPRFRERHLGQAAGSPRKANNHNHFYSTLRLLAGTGLPEGIRDLKLPRSRGRHPRQHLRIPAEEEGWFLVERCYELPAIQLRISSRGFMYLENPNLIRSIQYC
jgi:hypothetical protein